MNKNMISVILPVYNGEKFLRESIESILNQTYENFEFIIINDGSTDGSLKIINEYASKDPRIKVISRENKGLVDSLNEGIDLAKGKYIARMDADDISLPERLELQLNHMEENPEITILGTYIEVFGDESNEVESVNKWFNDKISSDNISLKISRGCPIAHPTVMMKTKFAKLEKYSSYCPAIEDYELWIRTITKGYTITNIDKTLLKYRVHSKSKSYIEKGELTLKQRAECKLNYFYDLSKKNVLVWGAGLGGRVFIDYIKSSRWSSKINILAIVDKGKEGYINNVRIVKPYEIKDIMFDYIFITTSLGYEDISIYLNNKGYKIIKDYIYGV